MDVQTPTATPSGAPTVDYATALQNLNTGGLSGNTLTMAQASLKNAYAQNGAPKAPVTPISASGITAPPPPLGVPQQGAPTSSTAGSNIGGIAAANNDALIQQQQAVADAAKAQVGQGQSVVQSYIDKLLGKGADQAQQETAAGIPLKTQQLNDITNEYNTKQLQFRRKQEAILNQPGVTREGAQQALSEVSRQNNAELADIAIRQSVAQGNLTAAQGLIDHKIALQYGDLKDVIGYQMKFLDQNQANLSDAQKNVLQMQIAKNQQEYQTQTENAKTLETTKLSFLKNASELNAPASVQAAIQAATTPEGAIAAAGKYGGGLAAEAQRANIAQSYASVDASRASAAKIRQEASMLGVGAQTLTGKPQSDSQAKANGYADRMAQANKTIQKLGTQFTGNFDFGGSLPTQLQGADRQSYEQAKRNFVTAALRPESGAAIAQSEYKDAEQIYFPQAGDGPDVLIQKAQARNDKINNVYKEANIPRPVDAGDVINSGGKNYKVADDGVTLIPQ